MAQDASEDYPLVTEDQIDPSFVDQIRGTPGGERILDCYACGTCSASCPVRTIDEEFNPRRIIRLALLGVKGEVLTSDFIWLCTGCFICQERCPQDVRITDLMMALRNIATEEGYPHPTVQAIYETLEQHGIILEIGEFENEKRTRAGLPERHVPPEPVRELMDSTGLKDKLGRAKPRPGREADVGADDEGGEG